MPKFSTPCCKALYSEEDHQICSLLLFLAQEAFIIGESLSGKTRGYEVAMRLAWCNISCTRSSENEGSEEFANPAFSTQNAAS